MTDWRSLPDRPSVLVLYSRAGAQPSVCPAVCTMFTQFGVGRLILCSPSRSVSVHQVSQALLLHQHGHRPVTVGVPRPRGVRGEPRPRPRDLHGCDVNICTGVEHRRCVVCGPAFNPFTPEGDQCQISSAGSAVILHHSMKNLAFHSYSDERCDYTTNSHYLTYTFFLGFSWFLLVPRVAVVAPFCLTLSLPRVINFQFPLQPHQKYYTTQYGELGFS